MLQGGIRQGVGLFLTHEYKYEGEWVNDQVSFNQKSGKGTLVSLNNDYVYDGDWSQDQQFGVGREIKGQNKYTGNFLKGKYHGSGILIDETLAQYDGEWAFGKKQGMGHWTSNKGEQYCGEFFNDLFAGKGQLTLENADIYVGSFEAARLRSGKNRSRNVWTRRVPLFKWGNLARGVSR